MKRKNRNSTREEQQNKLSPEQEVMHEETSSQGSKSPLGKETPQDATSSYGSTTATDKEIPQEERYQAIKQASIIGILANSILGAIKIIIGLLFHSLSLVSDGVDSATDVITSTISLIAAKITNSPPDIEHPYGHGRAETVATKMLSFVIFFVGAQLFVSSIKTLFSPNMEEIKQPILLIIVAVGSVIVKVILAIYKFRVGRRIESSLLIADAKNMRNDVCISTLVAIGIFLTYYLKMPKIDPIIAILVSIWIMKVATGIFLETSLELMDGINNPAIYQKVFQAVHRVDGAKNPHKVRIRKINNQYIVEVDIEVDGSLSVHKGHTIAMEVEDSIKRNIRNVYDVISHVEPLGRGEHSESFGVSESILEENITNGETNDTITS